MINSKSTFSRSAKRHESNSESSAWPKKVMSGCASVLIYATISIHLVLTFMMPGRPYPHPCSSSLSSSSPAQFALPFPFILALIAFRSAISSSLAFRHIPQIGTSWRMMYGSMDGPGTRVLHRRQDAVAKEPWHCRTRLTPARVSRVSIFCV